MLLSTGSPDSSAGKESACNTEDPSSTPGLGRSPGERKGYPLQYSGLENSMACIVHRVTKSRTRLSDFHFISLLPLYMCVCIHICIQICMFVKVQDGPWEAYGFENLTEMTQES